MLNKKNKYGGPNWGMIAIMLSTIWIWYAIFKIGFLSVLIWIIIGIAIGIIIHKIRENNNVI